MPRLRDRSELRRGYNTARRRRRQLLIQTMKTLPCTDCRGVFDPECMDFDHVRGKKLFNIGGSGTRPLEVVLAEIEKCDLICANCHRLRTKARRNNG